MLTLRRCIGCKVQGFQGLNSQWFGLFNAGISPALSSYRNVSSQSCNRKNRFLATAKKSSDNRDHDCDCERLEEHSHQDVTSMGGEIPVDSREEYLKCFATVSSNVAAETPDWLLKRLKELHDVYKLSNVAKSYEKLRSSNTILAPGKVL